MKRVLLYLPTFGLGGAERQGLEFAKYLIRNGHYACIVGSDNDGKVNELCLMENIRCFNLKDIKTPKIKKRLSKWRYWRKTGAKCDDFVIQFVHAMFSVIDSEKIDDIITYCAFPGTVTGTAKILRYQFPKFIWYQRDAGLYNWEEHLQKNAIRVADIRLANAVTGQNWIRRTYNLESTVIYNGTEEKAPVYSPDKWRERLQVPADSKIVTMVANLSSAKDHLTLLKAWKRFMQKRNNEMIFLVLAGTWADTYEEINSYIEQNGMQKSVILTGQIDDVCGLYNASAFAVLSSKSEGTSNAVIEACLAELPVVACNIEEIKDIVSKKNIPLLFSVGSVEGCEKCIQKAFSGDAEMIGAENRKNALEKFGIDNNFSRLMKLL